MTIYQYSDARISGTAKYLLNGVWTNYTGEAWIYVAHSTETFADVVPVEIGITSGAFSFDYYCGNSGVYSYEVRAISPIHGSLSGTFVVKDSLFDGTAVPPGEPSYPVTVYYGVGVAGITARATFEAMATVAMSGAGTDVTTIPAGQKIYICHPYSIGVASLSVGMFALDVLTPRETVLTGNNGVSEVYYVRESTNLLTGLLTGEIEVKVTP
jgi:hypothetical protein